VPANMLNIKHIRRAFRASFPSCEYESRSGNSKATSLR
jgi:hypothetical protein